MNCPVKLAPFSRAMATAVALSAKVLAGGGSFLLGWTWLSVGSPQLFAQGVTALNTGGGQPLVTSFQQVRVPTSSIPAQLSFEFGFGTGEVPSPGAFLDSFTVTVQDVAMINTLLLLTADANGVVWAPSTPGGIVFPPDSMVRTSVPFPSLQPVLAHQVAFAVTVPLPTAFVGPVNVYFDLFDNLDPTPSLGWHSAVVVPEPRTWAFLIAGLLLGWMRKRPKP